MPSRQGSLQVTRRNDVPVPLVVRYMSLQHSDHPSCAAGAHTTVPLPWPRDDGSWGHCYPLTIPPLEGRDGERRVFVYAEPGRLAPAAVASWLATIYHCWSDPSWDPPWGMVIDLDATDSAGLVVGVVKGCAFVVLDSRMQGDPCRYALVKLTGGRFLGRLHPAKRRILEPALRARAGRDGRSIGDEARELRQRNAAFALAETRTASPRRALSDLRRAFFRLLVDDLRDDLPKARESRLTGDDVLSTEAVTPRWANRVELAATIEAAMRRAGLTHREQQACDAVRADKSLAEWAREEKICDATARGYWHEAQRKLRPHLDLL